MTKHSAQRDAIYSCLCHTSTHPTAEEMYFILKPQFPNLSLATVYRNLDYLVAEGKALRITTDNADRFDADTKHHHHLICERCGKLYDLPPIDISGLLNSAKDFFPGDITSVTLMFSGTCPDCKYKK